MFIENPSFLFRAIPEAGYITLGTIRYGVKLQTARKPLNLLCTSSAAAASDRFSSISSNTSTNIIINNGNDENGDSSGMESGHSLSTNNSCTNCKACCCIDAKKFTLPWLNSASSKGDVVLNGRCLDALFEYEWLKKGN